MKYLQLWIYFTSRLLNMIVSYKEKLINFHPSPKLFLPFEDFISII